MRLRKLIWIIAVSGLIAVSAVAAAACGSDSDAKQVEALEDEVAELERAFAILSLDTASGGGINRKLMLDPDTGAPTVALDEVFSFDRRFAMCRVDTNQEAFKMQTFSMGEVTIEPHQFYMAMTATSVDEYAIETQGDGSRKVTMKGSLDCATEVGQAEVTFGSKTAAEQATYFIEAVDNGEGGGTAGDSFKFTVFFDPDDAPVNHAIFGPEFTFTGEMIDGEITIRDPASLRLP